MSTEIVTSLIVAVGGLLSAYIAWRRRAKPKSEYIDTAVAMYETIMKRQDAEITQLKVNVAQKEVVIAQLTAEIQQFKSGHDQL